TERHWLFTCQPMRNSKIREWNRGFWRWLLEGAPADVRAVIIGAAVSLAGTYFLGLAMVGTGADVDLDLYEPRRARQTNSPGFVKGEGGLDGDDVLIRSA